MVAISRSKVKIYMAPAGTAPSALASTSYLIAGEIKSYAKSGGDKDVEADPVFGGYVDKEKPVNQVEITLEVIPSLGTNSSRWDAVAYSLDTGTSTYTMASSGTATSVPADRAIGIQAYDGTNYKSWAFNNCNVTQFDLEHNADDNQTGTITFKFSPTNETGVSNFMTKSTALANLPAWTSLDNN